MLRRNRCHDGALGVWLLLAFYVLHAGRAVAAPAPAPAPAPAAAAQPAAMRYLGLCDASAAVAIDDARFVVADDERNTVVIYRIGGAEPVERIELSGHLDTKADKESDIEGAARVGQRIYWISSHGRSAKGEAQQRRQRFFATDVAVTGQRTLAPAGRAYANLLTDMLHAPALARFKLDQAAGLAPEAPGGLNIEGLAATASGALLIGFRSPLHMSRALVVPLLNPDDLLRGRQARFGVPMELDLGGRGIRSIERVGVRADARYLIVAGPTADNGRFALFEWSGHAGDRALPLPGPDFADQHPEALFVFAGALSAGKGQLHFLSDDGGRMVAGTRCKDLPPTRQAFRAATFVR